MLVGRDGELRLLADHLAAARPVIVVGEAGVGKTTLLRAAAKVAGRSLLEGGGLATLSWMEYLPLRRALGHPLTAADPQAAAAQVFQDVGSGILLIDDLQWADVRTLDTIALLTGRCGLLTAVRRGDPMTAQQLARMLSAGFAQVDLAPLSAAESADLVRSARPDLGAVAVDRLVSRSGGNPLLLVELARSGEPSPSLRLLLAARLRLLDGPGREAFLMLALAGRALPAEILGASGTRSLLDADLVVAEPTGLAPRHALLAELAADGAEASERRAVHARLARAVPDPGEAARHFAQAGEQDLALTAALQAADAASRPGERASHLALAASVAAGLGSRETADALRLRAARALDDAHDWAGTTAVLDQLASEDPEIRAWRQLLLARGAWAAGDVDALRAALAEGLALVSGTGSEVEVRLRIEQSRLPIFVDCDWPEGVRTARAALRLARATGIDVPRAEYLFGTALGAADRPEGVAHLESAMSAARASGDTHTEFLAANNLISFHESFGPHQRAREVAHEMISRASALGLGYWESAMRGAVVNLDVHAGANEHAVATAEELLSGPLEARTRDMLVECLGIALIDLGRVDEALRRVGAAQGEAIPDYRGQGQLQWVLAEAALWGGRPARALDLLHEFEDRPPGDPNIAFGQVARAWACVELGRDPGPAVPLATRPMLWAATPETAGLRLLFAGEHQAAAEHFERACELWAAYHRRGELRCAWAAGESLRRAGDLTAAVARLETAEKLATEMSAALFLARIHRSLRAAGQRRSAPRSTRRGGLTDRERQILELAGAGLTNAQIAAQLGIAPRTVVALVTSATAKLGAANRAQAAALAAQD